MIITVSGQPGAGSTTAAAILQQKLGPTYKIITVGELFKKMALEKGIPPAEVEKFWQTEEGKSEKTHHYLDDLTRRTAREEKDAILNCKLAAFQAQNADIKVLLIAPLQVRAERKSKSDMASLEATRKSLSERENIERSEWKRIYGFDYVADLDYYDLVINTKSWGAEKVANIIINALREKRL
ncbi:cytidylate kinase family protein [archaeon]|nr:cytidylate kinase family protein [archaeon]